MKNRNVCGECGAIFSSRLFGLSRKDNKTILCSDCEQGEAMREAEEQGLI